MDHDGQVAQDVAELADQGGRGFGIVRPGLPRLSFLEALVRQVRQLESRAEGIAQLGPPEMVRGSPLDIRTPELKASSLGATGGTGTVPPKYRVTKVSVLLARLPRLPMSSPFTFSWKSAQVKVVSPRSGRL